MAHLTVPTSHKSSRRHKGESSSKKRSSASPSRSSAEKPSSPKGDNNGDGLLVQNFYHFLKAYTSSPEPSLKHIKNDGQVSSVSRISLLLESKFSHIFGAIHLRSIVTLLGHPDFSPLDCPSLMRSTLADPSLSCLLPPSSGDPSFHLPYFVYEPASTAVQHSNLALHRLAVLSHLFGRSFSTCVLPEAQCAPGFRAAIHDALGSIPAEQRLKLQGLVNHRLQDILSICFQDDIQATPFLSTADMPRRTTFDWFNLPLDLKIAAKFVPPAADPGPSDVPWDVPSAAERAPLVQRHPSFGYETGLHDDADEKPHEALLFPELSVLFYENVLQHESHAHFFAIPLEERVAALKSRPFQEVVIVWFTLETSPSPPLTLVVGKGPQKYYRAVVRTKAGETRLLYPEALKPKVACAKILERLSLVQKMKIVPCVDTPNLRKELFKRDRDQQIEHGRYKFGVLYCKKGDVHACTHPEPDDSPDCRNAHNFFDSPLYRNEHGSADFNEFVAWLGEITPIETLKERHASAPDTTFLGGLHHVSGETVISSYKSFESDLPIVFHVSTLLPYTAKEKNQQLERKAHVGNDIVVIIFTEDDQPFDPRVFISQFNHIFFIVTKVGIDPDGAPIYRLAIAAKDTVPAFPPLLPRGGIFKGTPKYHKFFLSKLINGERSVYLREESFRARSARVNTGLLLDWASKYMATNSKA